MSKRAPKSSLAERLRSDILAGYFRPGEWLRQIDLEKRYDVGRFEVRQALAHLASGHTVLHEPNRGYRVAETNQHQRRELTEIRLLLEVPAALMVINNATDADIVEIENAAKAFEQALETSPYPETKRLNHLFHRTFFSRCGNQTLAELINELRESDLPNVASQWTSPDAIRLSNQDHLKVVEALKTRNEALMTETIRKHLTRWQQDQA